MASENPQGKRGAYAFISLGCPKNLVDSEQMLGILHERGFAVPEQVAVTGFDDLPLATRMVPQLTTVKQDIAAGARAMVDSLRRRIAGEDAPSTIMQPELVQRESA